MNTQAVKVKEKEPPRKAEGFSPSGAIQKVIDYFRGIGIFLHDVRMEMRQVTWPSRDDVRSTTTVVIITVFFFGIFLYFVDLGVQKCMDYIYKRFNLG
jgi:preprotein translocase subunit SecE